MRDTVQRIYDINGAFVREDASRAPVTTYETADGHNHWHLRAAMRYALYDANKQVEVAPSQKVGFCLADSAHVDPFGPNGDAYSQSVNSPLRFCQVLNPDAPQVTMGVSSGWRDVYSSNVAFQWVDVSDVKPGTYWLAASSDPDDAVVEASETNNGAAFAASPSVIPGFVAQPVNVTGIAVPKPAPVALTAASFAMGSTAPTFKIVKGPNSRNAQPADRSALRQTRS